MKRKRTGISYPGPPPAGHIRAHPVTVVRNLWRVMFLIVIPVLRGFFLALGGNLVDWASGAWLDILILAVMVGIAVWRWRRVLLWWDKHRMYIRTGVLIETLIILPWEKVVTVSAVEPLYLRPFGAVRLRVDAMGGSARGPDFALYLSHKNARALIERQSGGPAEDDASFTPTGRSILAFSLLGSNSFGGILFAATLISQSGRLIGRRLSDDVFGAVEQLSRDFAFGLPPAAAAIGYILLGGWLIGAYLHMVRHRRMQVGLAGRTLTLTGGQFTTRKYSLRLAGISHLDIRQSLTAKILGLRSLYLAAVGYGRRRDDLSCLIPAEKADAFEAARRQLFPQITPADRHISPAPKGWFKFIAAPALAFLGVGALTWAALAAGGWGDVTLFVGGMAALPALYILVLQVIDYRTGGLGWSGDAYTLRYCRGFNLHTIVLPINRVVGIEVRQSIFQRKKGQCDLIFLARAERRSAHRLRSLPIAQARQWLAGGAR
ncbi:MAG: PH domain-containing protein [Oscillospiraceae bacterium]|nr:PH domain-containing protein [Oscillospiraceae bacterium]